MSGSSVSGSPRPSAPIAFSEPQLAEVRRLQALYPQTRGALLPVLHMAQDTFGYVSLEVEQYVAALPRMIQDEMIADLIPTFGSVNMIGGELDR